MTRTDTELAVIAAVASTLAYYPVLFGTRLTLTIKYTRGGQPIAAPRTITVRVRTTVRMPLFADIWASTQPAIAGLAAVVAGWVRKVGTKVTWGLNRAVPEFLVACPVLDTALVTEDTSGATLGRLNRHTTGVSTGWARARPRPKTRPSMAVQLSTKWRSERNNSMQCR